MKSSLPRYRGFAPTVTAMINGDPVVGATAQQIRSLDVRRRSDHSAPGDTNKLSSENSKSSGATGGSNGGARDAIILQQAETIGIEGIKQDEKEATYSVWRDKTDYQIDWSRTGDEICRMVDALGYPYEGARTRVGDYEIVVEDAEVVKDLRFERRDVGKIWQMDEGRPIVICGEGLLRLNRIKCHDDRPFQLRLRSRLG